MEIRWRRGREARRTANQGVALWFLVLCAREILSTVCWARSSCTPALCTRLSLVFTVRLFVPTRRRKLYGVRSIDLTSSNQRGSSLRIARQLLLKSSRFPAPIREEFIYIYGPFTLKAVQVHFLLFREN